MNIQNSLKLNAKTKTSSNNRDTRFMIILVQDSKSGREGVLKLSVDGVCGPRSETLPISRDFSPSKSADFTFVCVCGCVCVGGCVCVFVFFFFKNLQKSGTISKVFLPPPFCLTKSLIF